ncbi:hypothetical protein BDF14DRAFT_1887188 [Spinellus fusiger]|nr:hypothetical protein BDF14DRAFT_1887188 [Spinellus fusiger]
MDVATLSELFKNQAPVFTGSTDSMAVNAWIKEMAHWKKLAGAAKASIGVWFMSPEELYSHLREKFPMSGYRSAVMTKLDSGTHFAPFDSTSCAREALSLYKVLTPSTGAAYAIAMALSKAFPYAW